MREVVEGSGPTRTEMCVADFVTSYIHTPLE
jgi:hypothetical protein